MALSQPLGYVDSEFNRPTHCATGLPAPLPRVALCGGHALGKLLMGGDPWRWFRHYRAGEGGAPLCTHAVLGWPDRPDTSGAAGSAAMLRKPMCEANFVPKTCVPVLRVTTRSSPNRAAQAAPETSMQNASWAKTIDGTCTLVAGACSRH